MDFINQCLEWFKSLFSGGAEPQTPMQGVLAAIRENITVPLGLPEAMTTALAAQSSLETAHWASGVYRATNSLFNRHVGSGKGYWTGTSYYANPGDPNLRVYTDISQSARDMAELLQDPLYREALQNLKQGSATGYFRAVAAAGFAATPHYAEAVNVVYESIA